MDSPAPTPTTSSASRGAADPAARTAAGARDAASAGGEAGGGFAEELRRAAQEPAKNNRLADTAPRPDVSTDPATASGPDQPTASAALVPPDAAPQLFEPAPVAAQPPSEAATAALPAAQQAACGGAEPPDAIRSPATPAIASARTQAQEGAAQAAPAAASPGDGAAGSAGMPPVPPQMPASALRGDPAAAPRNAPSAGETVPTAQCGAADAEARTAAADAAGALARQVPPPDACGAPPEIPLLRGVAEALPAERPSPVLPGTPAAPEAAAQNAAASVPAATAQAAAAEAPPPPAASAPRPPPPPPVRQVAPIAIALALGTGGAPRLTVALEPEELGRVEIRVERGGADGEAARVRVVAERPETLALLQRDARQLDRALQGAGIAVAEGGMRFSLAGHEQGAAGDGAMHGGGQARRGHGGGAAPDALLQPVAPARATGLALLDIAI